MYIYIYTCVHIYIHIPLHIHISMYPRTYVRMYIYVCIHTYSHVYIRTCIHSYMYACIHLRMYTYIYEYLYYGVLNDLSEPWIGLILGPHSMLLKVWASLQPQGRQKREPGARAGPRGHGLKEGPWGLSLELFLAEKRF